MARQLSPVCLLLAGIFAAMAGCSPQQPFYFFEDGDLSHYIGKATDIEYPDIQTVSLDEVTEALPPLTLDNPDPSKITELEVWELGLEEAIRLALENSKVLRNLSRVQFTRNGPVGEQDALLASPDLAATVYDPALVESNPRFGVEAALAAFDAQFSTSVYWEKNDAPQNIAGIVEAFRPRVFQQELGTFQAQLAKTTATGATWSLAHNVRYEGNNIPAFSRRFMSDWNVDLEAQFRQPLLQGNGVQFNRIAGPGSIPGFNNGVIIARINTDISLVDFEARVRNLVSDVERAYWGLYLAYRRLDAYTKARDRAQEAWRKEQEAHEAGGFRDRLGRWKGKRENVALTRHQFFLFQSLVEQALSDLYKAENHLRYIMGLAATDGRLIRPADEPTQARVEFDWYEAHAEALARSVELRRQRWKIKQRELELIAAKNWLLPRLDAVGRYRWRGLGDDLIDPVRRSGLFDNAYQSLTGGDFQEWQLGLELRFPLGFRKEMAAVRHAELNLARERAVLQDQELELSHLLAQAFRDLERSYTLCQTSYDRIVAAEDELRVYQAFEEAGLAVEEDRRVAAQQRAAEAEIDYFQSLVQYNLAIAQIHFRKGSLLEYNNVYLAEGPWPPKAYLDAVRRARARDASLYLDYGFTRPKVVSRGPYQQHAGKRPAAEPGAGPLPEVIPTPAPQPLPEPSTDRREPQAESTGILDTSPVTSGRWQPRGAWRPVAAGTGPGQGTSRLVPASLSVLAVRATGSGLQASGSGGPVKEAGCEQTDRAGQDGRRPLSPQGWKSSRQEDAWHEPVADPTPAEADRNASGRKGL